MHEGHRQPSQQTNRGTTTVTPTVTSRQQRDQQVRSRLFATRDETVTPEQLTAISQFGYETLLESKNPFALTVIPTASVELQAEQTRFIEPVEVSEGWIPALVIPTTLAFPQLQLQALFGSNGDGPAFDIGAILEIVNRDQTYGQNMDLFHHAIGVSLGEQARKSSTSLKNQIVSLEQDGNYVLTAPESTMLIGALIAAGKGPKVGETWAIVAAGSMTDSETDAPIFFVTQVTEGNYQIRNDFVSINGSVAPTWYLPTCRGRTFGHGSNY